MAQLAISGHSTRGREVIAWLEMLGGENRFQRRGDNEYRFYYIDKNDHIQNTYGALGYVLFDLEKFEEKFPYKVGDKVIYEDKIREITKMVWEERTNTIAYKLDDKLYCNVINDLQPYKEETMEERKYTDLRLDVDQDDKLATEVTIDGDKIIPPKNYLIGNITKVDNGMLVEFVKKQPQYPKTYEELIKPKFKVGDIITKRDSIENSWVVSSVSSEYYGLQLPKGSEGIGTLPIIDQDKYELVLNKFDVTTLVPFESKVLVRDTNTDKWRGAFYSYYNSKKFYTIGSSHYYQCIPYKGNEYLLGTTDDCDEYFKTW